MKKITACLVLVVFATASFCQQTVQKNVLTKTDYLQKSKKQKKAGLLLLGAGAVLIATSELIPSGDPTSQTICIYCRYENDGIKGAFGFSGVATMLGSIPFFIASRKNKKRAMRVSFKNQTVPQLEKSGFAYKAIPGLSFKIAL